VSDRRARLEALDKAVVEFVRVCEGASDSAAMVNREWTVKDVASHIAFWHESFARNLSDVAAGLPARPLRGNYAELNSRCMLEMRPLPMGAIVGRLLAAHRIVDGLVLEPSLSTIPYRHGSRDYDPEEHLEVVTAHIHSHIIRIQRALSDERHPAARHG
jgi:hypothetical protein